ncbi:MAG: MFS transporter [bacterium]|nr:MFS transporter [bacterium]
MMNDQKKFQTGNVTLISTAHLLHDTFSSFLAPILPLLIAKLSISYSLAGLLSVIQRLFALSNPFIGILADKMRMRYFVIFTPAVTAISMSLLGAAPSYTVLVVLLLVMSLSSTLFHVPAPVMIKRVSGDKTGTGMSFFMLGGEFARTLGPMVILGAISLWGLEGTYKLIPFGCIASAILYIRLRKINISRDFKRKEKELGARETFMKLLPFFNGITGIMLARGTMKAALTVFLPIYLTAKGESLWVAGISLSILQFAVAGGSFACGAISDRIGRKTTLLILSATTPVFMALFLFLDGLFTIPLLILIGLTLSAPTPVFLAMVQDIKTDRPAFINGIFMTINFVAAALCVMFVGILSDLIGLEKTYWLSAGLAVLAVVFTLRLKNSY